MPQDLRQAIYRAWRERRRGYDGAAARHLQAVEDACALLEDREPTELFTEDKS